VKPDDDTKRLDELIRAAIGRGPLPFDFERWKQAHPHQIEEFRTEPRPAHGPGTILIGRRRRLSRGVKIAVAAAILLAAMIMVSRFSPSLDGTTAAYAKVAQAVRNVPWMRIRYSGYRLDPAGNKISKEGALDVEKWYSFKAQVVIWKFPSGRIVYNDYAKQEVYTYNPVSHRIILTAMSGKRQPFQMDSPWSWVEGNIRTITTPAGGHVTRQTGQYQGQEVDIFEVLSTVQPGVAAIRDKIFVDRVTCLPIAEERTFIDTNTGTPQQVDTGIFDYPEQGPADIYALGVRRDIPTINSLPLPEWSQISMAYQSHHYRAPVEKYIAVVTREMTIRGNPVDSVEICYGNGPCFRGERHSLFGLAGSIGEQWAQQAPELGTTFDSMLKWSRAYKARGRIYITLLDRNHYYDCRRDEEGAWSRTERTFEDQGGTNYDSWNICPVAELGWPEIRDEADIIQDDYARENHLIRVEAQRGVFWLNPQRDYLCQRRVTTDGRMEEITEFGQTDDGHWYPKRIDRSGLNHTIWLETKAEFPEGIFDPNRLPKAETSQ
jgi:hypothetical protein